MDVVWEILAWAVAVLVLLAVLVLAAGDHYDRQQPDDTSDDMGEW